MLCINENINQNRRNTSKYVYQEPPKSKLMLPLSILGAGGLVGGGLYYFAKNQHKEDDQSVYDFLGIKKDSILDPKIDPSIPLNMDKWYKDSNSEPKNDQSIPLTTDKWKRDSILDPKIDPSIPLNADRW